MRDEKLLEFRAITAMREALRRFREGDTEYAYIFYGSALAYEEYFDLMQENQEVNSLYTNNETYRELCLDWARRRKADV